MGEKRFGLGADQFKPLAEGRGGCFATDMITVEGRKVGYMHREDPENGADSGWRFLAGTESQGYLDDADNLAFYDVNTIANYDLDVIPLLGAPVGSAFERDRGTGGFVAADSPEPD